MRRIESAPVSQWPEHLKRAWEILQESSKTTEKSARAVVLEFDGCRSGVRRGDQSAIR